MHPEIYRGASVGIPLGFVAFGSTVTRTEFLLLIIVFAVLSGCAELARWRRV